MRVQPHLPSSPFTAMVTSRFGAARLACSAAKSPAPPEPRTRMSVRMRFMPGRVTILRAGPAAAPCPRSGARLEHPQAREVRGAVVAVHALERLHGAVPVAGVELRLAEAQLRVLGALEPALLDALLDEREA